MISLSCYIQEESNDVMPLVEKIEHNERSKQNVLEKFIDIKKFMVLNSSLVEKSNFYELSYVINHE